MVVNIDVQFADVDIIVVNVGVIVVEVADVNVVVVDSGVVVVVIGIDVAVEIKPTIKSYFYFLCYVMLHAFTSGTILTWALLRIAHLGSFSISQTPLSSRTATFS